MCHAISCGGETHQEQHSKARLGDSREPAAKADMCVSQSGWGAGGTGGAPLGFQPHRPRGVRRVKRSTLLEELRRKHPRRRKIVEPHGGSQRCPPH
eukprot:7381805-Prymnesium_polylepis.1